MAQQFQNHRITEQQGSAGDQIVQHPAQRRSNQCYLCYEDLCFPEILICAWSIIQFNSEVTDPSFIIIAFKI